MRTTLTRLIVGTALAAAAWIGAGASSDSAKSTNVWKEVAPNVFRTAGYPTSYVVRHGSHGILFGLPDSIDNNSLKEIGITTVDSAFITHHHRDSVAAASLLVRKNIAVRAPVPSRDWLEPQSVARFWKTALPEVVPGKTPGLRDRSFGVFDYFVHPTGIEGITFDLKDGESIDWNGWQITVVSTPGHSRDHTVFLATTTDSEGSQRILFCGDAIAAPGKLWTPFTTDWHHCYADGLDAAAASLRAMAKLNPTLLCPEHGPPMDRDVREILNATADKVEDVALLKSFERYTKEIEKDPPSYPFLAENQVATAGEKPFTQLSDHLFITGNTYVISSKDGPICVIDPFGAEIVERIESLQRERSLGPIEVVLISHAHNDHYTGAFQLPSRDQWKLWTLDVVARPIAEPFYYRAPYLDARSLKADRLLRQSEQVTWREYSFRVRHQPGQSFFSMGIETEIDGRKCSITADNFFHADQFTGTGGWSGRNRSWPFMYAMSAQQVLDFKPEWVLAEHGGPFEFQTEDFERRVRWAQRAGKAADELCLSGGHLDDWNPHRLHVEPFLTSAKLNSKVKVTLVASNDARELERITVRTNRPDIVEDASWELTVLPGQTKMLPIELSVRELVDCGRHVVPLVAEVGDSREGSDLFIVIETKQPICLE